MEEWRDIQGYAGIYQISNYGKVKSFKRSKEGVLLNPSVNKCGYRRVDLVDVNHKNKQYFVHRLVAKMFLNNLNNYNEINHINGVKIDNIVTNIEWCSAKHNSLHRHKLHPELCKGTLNSRCLLTEKEVIEIYTKTWNCNDKSHREIGQEYGVSKHAVFDIKHGRNWNSVTNHILL